jgi:hypothetical protein
MLQIRLQIRRMLQSRKLLVDREGVLRNPKQDDTMSVIFVEPARESTFEDRVTRFEHILIRLVALASIIATLTEILRSEFIRLFGY